MNNYQEPEDFLTEESFIEWHNKSNNESVQHWNDWMIENPGKKELVNRAIELLDFFTMEETISDEQQQRAEERLMRSIAAKKVSVLPIKRVMSWAAAAAVILTASLAIFHFKDKPTPTYTTAYGVIEKKVLPDGSEIILNAHSQVKFKNNWQPGDQREVWVTGEAFFHVKKTENYSRFIVHTNHFDVIVTGTKFDVINEAGNSNIVLKEGSVTIKTDQGDVVYMKPGDFAEFKNDRIIKKNVQVDRVVAWTEQKFDFDKTPLKEVARRISAHYNIPIELEDAELENETISGIVPNDNLDVLLRALEATNQFSITRSNGKVIIHRLEK